MFKTKLNVFRILVFFAFAIGIYFGNFQFVLDSSLGPNVIALSLVLDLVVWVPLLYFFILVRSGSGKSSFMPLLVSVGVFTSLRWAPQGSFLSPIKEFYLYFLLALATAVFVWFFARFLMGWKRTADLSGEQRVIALAQRTAGKGNFASLIQAEWLTIYYGLFAWRRVTTADNQESFSYHHKSGSPAMLIFLSLFQIPSLCFTHIIFHSMSPVIAMVFTVGHIYTLFFGLSQAMAIKHRPIFVKDGKIRVRCGLMFDFDLPVSEVNRVEDISGFDLLEKQEGRLEINMLGHSNLQLVLNQKFKVPLMAGLSKSVDTLVLGLDDLASFKQALRREGLV